MGLVERFNATIVDRPRKLSLALGRNWTELVGQAVNVYNTTWHDIIRAVPTQLWAGSEEERKAALKNTEIQWIKGQPTYTSPQSFELGMLVLVYNHVRASIRGDKMSPLWDGPVRLERKTGEHTWEYSELQPHTGRGRKRVTRVHEDHIQQYDDKR